MRYFETERIELKEKVSDTLAKEITAFLNTDGGTVYVGIRDDGTVVGVDKVDSVCKKISDTITDTIEPDASEFVKTCVEFEEDKPILKIEVQKGFAPLYCIKKYGFSPAGCPIRIATTCKAMSAEEIKTRYERNFTETDLMLKTAVSGKFTFNTLKAYYAEHGYHLEEASFADNLKLRTSDGGYNKLAELLADNNMLPLIVVKFRGTDKSSISERNNYGNCSLLFACEKIKNRLAAENVCKSDTTVRPRKDEYLFDLDCAGEAVINALVHNDWNITEPLVSIFSDRIEIISHGGLPRGQTLEMFFRGISKPRNNALMRIFSDMNQAEHTGHGIPMIVKKYGRQAFEITDRYVNVTIPFDGNVLNTASGGNLGGNETGARKESKNEILDKILLCCIETPRTTAEELSKKLNTPKRTVERYIAELKRDGKIIRTGSNVKGQWKVVK
ncbi:MAG: ATP-binding protein [Synergistaceae bacterium]|nr:ATP-binding protein [Synergistaceae bacterium]